MKVYVAIYTHRDGPDMRVFRSKEAAEKCRAQIAKENWHNLFHKDHCMPDDPTEIADAYFGMMQQGEGWASFNRYESFVVEEFEVEE